MKDYTDIIIAPVITEKATDLEQNNNVYTFKVVKSATKPQIKYAIEKAFGVHVEKVTTLITKPKAKRVGKYPGQTKTYKKAFVKIKNGESIEM